MKRFIKNSVHFGVYLLLLNLVCYLLIKTTYYDQYTQFDPSYDTYLFSDSHGHQLDTLTQSVGIFNFSDPSDSYEDMLRKIRYTVAHSEVKRILLSADLHNLSTYREEYNNLDRSAIYTTQEDYKSSADYFYHYYFKRFVPLLNGKSRDALLIQIKSWIPKQLTPVSLWNEKTEAAQVKDAEKRVVMHFDQTSRSVKMEQILQEIIAICKENDILLEGVLFPLTPEYRTSLKGRGYDAMNLFSQANCTVLDFSTTFENRADYFRDQDHLNELGAQAFIRLLRQ